MSDQLLKWLRDSVEIWPEMPEFAACADYMEFLQSDRNAAWQARSTCAELYQALQLEAEGFRRDAQRYRWFRDSANPATEQIAGLFRCEWDEAIDEEIEKEGGQ